MVTHFLFSKVLADRVYIRTASKMETIFITGWAEVR